MSHTSCATASEQNKTLSWSLVLLQSAESVATGCLVHLECIYSCVLHSLRSGRCGFESGMCAQKPF